MGMIPPDFCGNSFLPSSVALKDPRLRIYAHRPFSKPVFHG
jgi:hypothetical protein